MAPRAGPSPAAPGAGLGAVRRTAPAPSQALDVMTWVPASHWTRLDHAWRPTLPGFSPGALCGGARRQLQEHGPAGAIFRRFGRPYDRTLLEAIGNPRREAHTMPVSRPSTQPASRSTRRSCAVRPSRISRSRRPVHPDDPDQPPRSGPRPARPSLVPPNAALAMKLTDSGNVSPLPPRRFPAENDTTVRRNTPTKP